jgi:hypothetical protein
LGATIIMPVTALRTAVPRRPLCSITTAAQPTVSP